MVIARVLRVRLEVGDRVSRRSAAPEAATIGRIGLNAPGRGPCPWPCQWPRWCAGRLRERSRTSLPLASKHSMTRCSAGASSAEADLDRHVALGLHPGDLLALAVVRGRWRRAGWTAIVDPADLLAMGGQGQQPHDVDRHALGRLDDARRRRSAGSPRRSIASGWAGSAGGSSRSGRRRSIRRTLVRARSRLMASRRARSTPRRCRSSRMSMKSLTITPPRSRSRSCRAISLAARRFIS